MATTRRIARLAPVALLALLLLSSGVDAKKAKAAPRAPAEFDEAPKEPKTAAEVMDSMSTQVRKQGYGQTFRRASKPLRRASTPAHERGSSNARLSFTHVEIF
jgi:hypothetical protein